MNPDLVEVTGDRYFAVFHVPEKAVRQLRSAHAIALAVGAPYIAEAVQFLNPTLKTNLLKLEQPFGGRERVQARYTIQNCGEIRDLDKSSWKKDLLRASNETERLELSGLEVKGDLSKGEQPYDAGSGKQLVYVTWLSEAVSEQRSRPAPDGIKPRPCAVHIQTGFFGGLQTGQSAHDNLWTPARLATPTAGRVVVLNLGEISGTHRVRKAQSYEAIAVDLLRYLRGERAEAQPAKDGILTRLSMNSAEVGVDVNVPPWSILAVRLNQFAVFLYVCAWKDKYDEVGAWIVCHKKNSAPLGTPEVVGMLGFTGFVSAAFAATPSPDEPGGAPIYAIDATKLGLAFQNAAYNRGNLSMLFDFREKETPFPAPGYDRLFKECEKALGDRSTAVKDVLSIEVDIKQAVAHRTPWFMARSVVIKSPRDEKEMFTSEFLAQKFKEKTLQWLTSEKIDPGKDDIPVVEMGRLKLTDRREIEDYLAIYQALKVFSESSDQKPLNLAVFGSPGSGKSFGVKQVVHELGSTQQGNFQRNQLEFNLGQFKSLNDLPAALHLVRNECLTGKIPVVFFDEFDSTFNGEPFGWLKYLLAPMQDGSFYDNGATYKIGKAAFIFAGGVNRSFEEMNGRMRNPGFCEAKGPDFISRLKAHLNIQGINKPEDDGDQGRYVLRRAVVLHGILRERFQMKDGEAAAHGLLHESVADAFLSIERFKHGVRSLESIVKMCSVRQGHSIGPSDLPSMEQMEMHVDASKLLEVVDRWGRERQ